MHRGPIAWTHCPQCGYDLSAGDAQEMRWKDEALRQLVATWHGLTPAVRKAIMDLARATICQGA